MKLNTHTTPILSETKYLYAKNPYTLLNIKIKKEVVSANHKK